MVLFLVPFVQFIAASCSARAGSCRARASTYSSTRCGRCRPTWSSCSSAAGGTAPRLERRAAARGVADRVRFLGRVAEAELPVAHRAADVFAMLCRDRWGGLEAEGFGIVFLEAGASGLACVAGRSGGSHEAVLEGETGFVVDPRDVDGVATRLRRLLDDAELRARLGAAARARAESEWSYDRRVEPLARLAAGDLTVLR